MNGARLLLDGLFDYAGLFPPSSLPLPVIVERYAEYRASADAWMLGRLVVPVGRLADLESLVAARPHPDGAAAWPLSVLGSGSVEDDRQALAEFASGTAVREERLRVESVDVRVASRLEARRALALARDGWTVYCEPVGPEGDLDAILDATAIGGMRSKLRCGGPSADQMPTAVCVAQRLAGCVQRGISLKATAGLHHAVAGSYPMSDTDGGAPIPMHGYLNLLVAAGVAEAAGAAAVRAPEVVAALARILTLTSRPVLTPTGVLTWHDGPGPLTEGPLHDIAPSARALVRGIGTCSFDTPRADARSLDLA